MSSVVLATCAAVPPRGGKRDAQAELDQRDARAADGEHAQAVVEDGVGDGGQLRRGAGLARAGTAVMPASRARGRRGCRGASVAAAFSDLRWRDRLEQAGQLVEQLGLAALLLEDRSVGGPAENRVDLAQVAADHAGDGALDLVVRRGPSVASRSSSSATVSRTMSAATSRGWCTSSRTAWGRGHRAGRRAGRGSRRCWSRCGPSAASAPAAATASPSVSTSASTT